MVPSISATDAAGDILQTDQDKICAWLTEDVPDWTPPKQDILEDLPSQFDSHKPSPSKVLAPSGGGPGLLTEKAITIPRVDLYQKLVDAYEAERFRWTTFKTNARPGKNADATAADFDNFNRMLATYAPIVDSKLEALWTMVLIRVNIIAFAALSDLSTLHRHLKPFRKRKRTCEPVS